MISDLEKTLFERELGLLIEDYKKCKEGQTRSLIYQDIILLCRAMDKQEFPVSVPN